MKNLMWVVVLVLVVVGGMWWMGVGPFAKSMTPSEMTQMAVPTTATVAPVANEVVIQDFAYAPATLTVKAGTTVTFTNKDLTSHSATASDGVSFDTGLIGQNESATVTFDKPGTYAYYCSVHPSMKGTIVVE